MASKSTRKKVAFNSEQRKMEENLENSNSRKKIIEIETTRNLKINENKKFRILKIRKNRYLEIQKFENPGNQKFMKIQKFLEI